MNLNYVEYVGVGMSLEEPMGEKEKSKLHEILTNPRELDKVINQALKGWRRGRVWKQKTKKS